MDYSRQTELLVPHEFTSRINVVGCGATGSFLTYFLLKMGFRNVHVYDFDTIEEHNIPNQLFTEEQINLPKVEAIANIYNRDFKDEQKRLFIHNYKIDSENANILQGVVFCCTDTMSSRKQIYEMCYKNGNADVWIEPRLGLWGAYIYTLYKDSKKDWMEITKKYEETLYDDEEAEVSSCGVSQTGLPSAVNTASVCIMQLIRWHKNEAPYYKVTYQIPEMISITEEE